MGKKKQSDETEVELTGYLYMMKEGDYRFRIEIKQSDGQVDNYFSTDSFLTEQGAHYALDQIMSKMIKGLCASGSARVKSKEERVLQ